MIRIWDTSTGEQVGKLRRGKDKAEVNCISFSSDSEWLCVSSDRGTVHIFNLANNGGSESAKAQKSRLSFMGGLGLLPSSLDDYVGSDFSFAQLHLTVPRSICSFGQANNLIIVIGQDGTFYRYAYDSEQGGEGKREDHILFLKDKEDD